MKLNKYFNRDRNAGPILVVAAACLFVFTVRLFAIEAQIDLSLAIPECKLLLNSGDRAELPQSQISRMVLQVRPKVGAVRYGSIRVMLNGESINRDMTVNGVEGGYDCVIDSARGSYLPLHAGENSIDVSLTDTWNHTHQATFTLVAPAKTPS